MFKTIYGWFYPCYGQQLYYYLVGYNCDTQTITGANKFVLVGGITLVIVLAFIVLFYGIDRAKLAKWWKWLIFALITSFINFFVAARVAFKAYNSGDIGDCLMCTRGEDGEVLEKLITPMHCWGFGWANFLLSLAMCILFSFFVKRFSKSCRHTPWKSIWPK